MNIILWLSIGTLTLSWELVSVGFECNTLVVYWYLYFELGTCVRGTLFAVQHRGVRPDLKLVNYYDLSLILMTFTLINKHM